MNAINDIDTNSTNATGSSVNADDNANKTYSDNIPHRKGAIPKISTNHETSKKQSKKCMKINNNAIASGCKMGLGNGNDSNLHFINNVTKDLDPFSLKPQECENVDPNFLNGSTSEFLHSTVTNQLRCVNGVTKDCKCNIFSSNESNASPSCNSHIDFTSRTVTPQCFGQINGIETSQPGTSADDTAGETSKRLSQLRDRKVSSSSSSTHSSDNTDTGNDDSMSVSYSDEGCIYTYKGGDLADLPDSFFVELRGSGPDEGPALQLPFHENNVENPQPVHRSRESSPEMDYLEMDFDPGPSCEADSESSADIDLEEQNIQLHSSILAGATCMKQINEPNKNPAPTEQNDSDLNLPSTSNGIQHRENIATNYLNVSNIISPNTPTTSVTSQGELQATSLADQLLYKDCVDQRLAASIYNQRTTTPPTPVMLWEESDIQLKQFNQQPNGSATTAVLNALLILNKIPPRIFPEWAKQRNMPTIIDDTLDLPEYLIARSKSFPNHEDLITGLKSISNGSVYSRFFATWPERNISLSHWLAYWLERNVVPIITINQQTINKDHPAPEWQHHTVYGVKPPVIYLTDPLQSVPEDVLWQKLCSDSVLFVKRADILAHWNTNTDLGPLCTILDRRWDKLNTLGKVVHLIRSAKGSITERPCFSITTHIPIPTSVRAGVTLVTTLDNPACETLEHCPELPLKMY